MHCLYHILTSSSLLTSQFTSMLAANQMYEVT